LKQRRRRKKKQKILVPLDGSHRAMNTVKYITKFEPFLNADMVLFHVFSSVPEGFWDLETDPRITATVKQVHAWEAQQKKPLRNTWRVPAGYC